MDQAHLYLGDEAVARGAVDGGLAAAYGYPGTPSTEILETLLRPEVREAWSAGRSYVARWCTNEKAAYEEALGASMAGSRAMVTMKHVGLNVAADPFMNSALLDLEGGMLVAVADDPGMHSSQNEQDTRYYADFARTVCLEPSDQQEAYEMARAAFELSEELRLPVVLRIVTRVAHARGVVTGVRPAERLVGVGATPDRPGRGGGWMLVPSSARRQWAKLLARRADVVGHTLASRWNTFVPGEAGSELAVVTCGIGRAYLEESVAELEVKPHRLHVGYYPVDDALFAQLPAAVTTVLVLEDGYPFVERALARVLPRHIKIIGRLSGAVPEAGELTPDTVRGALGLPSRQHVHSRVQLPVRPPQLCQGCPHAESFSALRDAIGDLSTGLRPSDIGCYALGALPPHAIVDSVVCMGASIGMAKGAAESGVSGVVAAIGDSTFLHSGIPALIDAVEANTPMTVLILDNGTVAMTGGQPTAVPPGRIEAIVQGIGVEPDHIVTLSPSKANREENAQVLRQEIAYPGPSVVVSRRGCVRFAARMHKGGE